VLRGAVQLSAATGVVRSYAPFARVTRQPPSCTSASFSGCLRS